MHYVNIKFSRLGTLHEIMGLNILGWVLSTQKLISGISSLLQAEIAAGDMRKEKEERLAQLRLQKDEEREAKERKNVWLALIISEILSSISWFTLIT